MPSPASARSTLDLVALAARRGEEDVRTLARLARGEPVAEEAVAALVRAGLVRAGRPPRVPARLLVPVLALEAALGLRSEALLSELHALLCRAQGVSQRDSLLSALAAELEAHLEAIRDGRGELDPEQAGAVVADLAETVRRLHADEADPVLVTRVAELAARLVARLARGLTPRLRRSRVRPPVQADASALAAAVAPLTVSLPRPRLLPSASTLAAALAGPPETLLGIASVRELPVAARCPLAQVRSALATPDPLAALYAGYSVEEALRRHTRTVGLGRHGFADAGWVPGWVRKEGPAPLAWTTELLVAPAAITTYVTSVTPTAAEAA